MSTRLSQSKGPFGPVYLSEEDVSRLLPPDAIYDVVVDTLKSSAAGRVVEGSKTGLTLDDDHGLRFMGGAPACLHDLGVAGIKWFTTCAENSQRGLPRVPATIVLCDSVTGMLRGVLDATALTPWRTAALAIAAIKSCAARPDKATVVGLGAIGKALARYLALQLCVRRIFVVGRDFERTRRDSEELARELPAEIVASNRIEDAVHDADVVITATGLKRDAPILSGDWIKPGATVCGLGSYQEIDLSVILKAQRIFVDNSEGCAQRGNLAPLFKSGRLGPDRITGLVADLVAGNVQDRAFAAEIVVIALIGLGALDIALAARAIGSATACGRGQRLSPAAEIAAERSGQHA